MSGWVKLHRAILDHPRASDPEWVAVWVYLLLNAAHRPRRVTFEGSIITLEPGQLLTGRKVIAEATGVHESKVFRVMRVLKNEQQIEHQTSNRNTLVSITNWGLYQGSEQQAEQPVNNKRTASEQQNEQPVNNASTDESATCGGCVTLAEQRVAHKVNTLQEDKNKNIEDTKVSSRPTNTHSEIVEAWNELNGLPKVERLTANRKTHLKARLADSYWREHWQRALGQIPSSDFLSGRKTKWRATFDWFLRPESVVKIIEGQYHDGSRAPTVYSDSEKY